MQPLESVTRRPYEPAATLTKLGVVAVDAPDHWYEKGPVPPMTVLVTVPLAPGHTDGALTRLTLTLPVLPTVPEATRVHELASVTVTCTLPPARPLMVAVVRLSPQTYDSEPVPPEAVTVAVPSVKPQRAGVVVTAAWTGEGCWTVKGPNEALQLAASVTVTR